MVLFGFTTNEVHLDVLSTNLGLSPNQIILVSNQNESDDSVDMLRDEIRTRFANFRHNSMPSVKFKQRPSSLRSQYETSWIIVLGLFLLVMIYGFLPERHSYPTMKTTEKPRVSSRSPTFVLSHPKYITFSSE